MKVCFVIPVYNESGKVESVLNIVKDAGYDSIFVNDGSTDGTDETAAGLASYTINHCVNRGQGAALRSGTKFAVKLGYDVIVHFDADGQHNIDDAVKLVEFLRENNKDIVLGSRFLAENKLPVKKKIILHIAKLFSRNILNLNFSDPQCGLRVFRADVYPKMQWKADNFMHCTEILGLIAKNKLDCAELPITVNYGEYSSGKQVRPRMRMGIRMMLSRIFD